MSKRPEDQVACPSCSVAVTRRNFSRHCRVVHGTTETTVMCRAAYSTPGSRSRSSSHDSRDYAGASPVGDASTHTLIQAATAVLDQHHSFSERELITYLADCYPEVPEELRRPLVIGAVAGAQRAAHMYFIVEKNKASPDENKRGVAANSACALSFWNMGLRTESRTPSSSRRSSKSGVSPAVASLSTSETQPVTLADLQLPVSLEQSHHDWERERQSVLCEGSTYEIIAAAPPDVPLLLTFDAATTSGTVAGVEPYVPPVLPGSSYVDMPYVPSTTTQRQPQAGADPDPDVEPDLSIDVPADPALFESLTETEEKKREEGEEKKEETQKKKEEAELKKTEEAPKKKEDLLVGKKRAVQKDAEGGLKKKETKKSEEPKKRGEEVRKVDRDPVNKTRGPSTERRRTSPRRASPRSASRDESPPRTVPGWEWREFLDYRRRTAATRPPLKKHRK